MVQQSISESGFLLKLGSWNTRPATESSRQIRSPSRISSSCQDTCGAPRNRRTTMNAPHGAFAGDYHILHERHETPFRHGGVLMKFTANRIGLLMAGWLVAVALAYGQ